MDRSHDVRGIVLVLEPDMAARARTVAALGRAGLVAEGAASVEDADALLQATDFDVIVLGAFARRSWEDVVRDSSALRESPHVRCSMMLYGSRPGTELTELAWACQAAAHANAEGGFEELVQTAIRLVCAAAPTSRATASGVTVRRDGPHKVLLVDDSEMTLELLQSALIGLGFDVRIAVAVVEAASIAASWKPEIVILDLRRPDAPGTTVCSQLKKMGIPLILLASSLPARDLAYIARTSGADGFVSKSLGASAFAARVRELVEDSDRGIVETG
jgi:DNA-binding response OmpR family regulator